MGACSGGPSQARVVYATKGCAGPAGAKGSKASEHVPDRLGELARHLDAGHLGAALAAETALGCFVVRGVDGVAGGVHGGLG
jgi:hypothetical protein